LEAIQAMLDAGADRRIPDPHHDSTPAGLGPSMVSKSPLGLLSERGLLTHRPRR
jgi:hypothetical protein